MTAIACGSHVPVQEENKTADTIILKLHLLSNRVSLFYFAVKKTLLHAGSVMWNKMQKASCFPCSPAWQNKFNTRGCTACFPIPLHYL